MKKLSKETKYKLIYSGELMLFAVIFLTLSILKFTRVMNYNETRRIVFNWITIAGGAWGIADFTWAMCSKKRQQRISLLDKFLILPLTLFILTFDFISLIAKPTDTSFYINMIAIAFLYVALIYIFQAIYHFYRPIPGLLDDDEDDGNKEKEESEE